jgi:hypothetical protein
MYGKKERILRARSGRMEKRQVNGSGHGDRGKKGQCGPGHGDLEKERTLGQVIADGENKGQ